MHLLYGCVPCHCSHQETLLAIVSFDCWHDDDGAQRMIHLTALVVAFQSRLEKVSDNKLPIISSPTTSGRSSVRQQVAVIIYRIHLSLQVDERWASKHASLTDTPTATLAIQTLRNTMQVCVWLGGVVFTAGFQVRRCSFFFIFVLAE
jgi:hypothetical protein